MFINDPDNMTLNKKHCKRLTLDGLKIIIIFVYNYIYRIIKNVVTLFYTRKYQNKSNYL